MKPFLNGTTKNKATSSQKDILINWQHILMVEQNDSDIGITLTMTTGKTIPVDSTFEDFRKLLLEYALTLDDCHRVITSSSKEHDWEMIDRD